MLISQVGIFYKVAMGNFFIKKGYFFIKSSVFRKKKGVFVKFKEFGVKIETKCTNLMMEDICMKIEKYTLIDFLWARTEFFIKVAQI